MLQIKYVRQFVLHNEIFKSTKWSPKHTELVVFSEKMLQDTCKVSTAENESLYCRKDMFRVEKLVTARTAEATAEATAEVTAEKKVSTAERT